MNLSILFFYACPRLRFLYVETDPGPQRPVPTVCKMLCSNVRGLARNITDLAEALSQYDILLCSETLVLDMSHASELLISDSIALSCWAGTRYLGPEGWPHANEMTTEHFSTKCYFLGFVV